MKNIKFFVIVGMLLAVAGCSAERDINILTNPTASTDTSSPTDTVRTTAIVPASVSVSSTLACPSETVAGRVNKWGRPGANAYTGSVGYAVSLFQVPGSVKDAWRKLVKEKKPALVDLKPGDRFCSMLYSARGYHHVWNNVEVSGDWTTNGTKPAGSDVYSVEENGFMYELVRPHVCDNWSYRVRRVVASSTLKKSPPDSSFKLVVRVLDFDTAPKGFKERFDEINSQESNKTYPFEDGSVSRDLGSEISKLIADGDGPLKYLKEGRCFKARLLLPGQEWGKPQEICGDRSILYWSKTVSRNAAMEPNSQFGIEFLSSPKGCQIRYPRKNQLGQYLIDTRLNDGGRLSELAVSASKNGNPGFNLNTFAMQCGSID